MLRQQQLDNRGGQISGKFNCLGGEPKGLGSGRCDNRDISAYVDTLFKRKIGHLMDDVYNLKKQMMNADCSARKAQFSPPKEPVSLAKPRINYASEDLGARIIDVKAQPMGGTNIIKTLLGLDFSANPPVNMLRSGLSPGACFGFNGSRAIVTLHLAKTIIVEALTLTHVAREMTPSLCVKSAPKDFDVYVSRERYSIPILNNKSFCQGLPLNNSKRQLLGQWTFDNAANRRTQSYTVHNDILFRNLVFAFNSNHGANSTCIYR